MTDNLLKNGKLKKIYRICAANGSLHAQIQQTKSFFDCA